MNDSFLYFSNESILHRINLFTTKPLFFFSSVHLSRTDCICIIMKLSIPMHVTLLQKTILSRRNFYSSSSSFSNPNPENPNLISHYFSLLQSSPNPKHLRHLHAHLLRTSLFNNVILSSKLILSYSKHNLLLPYSHFVFLNIPNPNNYSWNMIIGEFSRSNFPEKSLQFFNQMRILGFPPDEFTLPSVLRACVSIGSINWGVCVHGFCVKVGLVRSLFVASAMVFMYVNLGKIFEGRKVFDEMSQRDYVLWTSMLAGYAQHGESMLALDVFKEMMEEGIELDWVVMVSLVLVFSQLGWLRHGKNVHGWCIRRCSDSNLSLTLGNALIDMYVKCGNLDNARSVFNTMPVKDVISWSSLILGYGLNGNMGFALELFDQMCSSGFKPNGVTFLGVLSACAHAGMVEKARFFFYMMKDYDISVELKHYACMVDCLGRAGHLEEAEKFIEEMPVQPDGAVLGALLGGCRVHGDIEVAERIGKKLLRMEPERGGYYVLLANIYADSGRFREAERVREFMKQKNLSKLPGCSSIESDDCFNSSGHNKVLFDFET